ncbi:hypothetical protein VFPPC_18049 [Pochonia chlamydosporia 170]|uniref:Uncharacterized protein n=1 Tax=Pochonia chlamydosporia 170 TaxID=1380566 RepID=A0A219AR53_METCM|nr:hypothetical protein VFPPC_18049 [Pochonia chlamydosporia 170]OWT42794.1 hypothetical protein VFPPC_18049 [Pochonia chlamydosporia 170]
MTTMQAMFQKEAENTHRNKREILPFLARFQDTGCTRRATTRGFSYLEQWRHCDSDWSSCLNSRPQQHARVAKNEGTSVSPAAYGFIHLPSSPRADLFMKSTLRERIR